MISPPSIMQAVKHPLSLLGIVSAVFLLLLVLGWYFWPALGDLIEAHWVIMPIAFVAAAIANATAIGGGFLFFPLFVFVYALTPLAALKLSFATQAFGMSAGSLGWWRSIDVRAAGVGGASALLGMIIGTYWAFIPVDYIKLMFGWVSLGIFLVIIIEMYLARTSVHSQAIFALDVRLAGYVLFSIFGGLFTAWTAIGVGEFIALYLLLVYRVRIEQCIATGVAVLALTSIAGLVFHSHLGGIPWHLVLFTVPGVLLGGFCGATLGRKLERRASHLNFSPLKCLFAIIILIDAIMILFFAYGIV